MPFFDCTHQDMLDHVLDFTDDLSPWEQNFIESIHERLANGDELTEGQAGKLSEIYESLA